VPIYDGPGALASAAEAGIGFAEERRPDTTLAAQRLDANRQLRRQRQVERICDLGPRVVFELLDELNRHHGLGDDLDQRLARYAGLDPLTLAAIGGDRFARLPIHMVAAS